MRGGALTCIALSALLLYSLFSMLGVDASHVSFNELNTTEFKDNASLADASAVELVTPPIVDERLSGENSEVLAGWLDGIAEPGDRQDFVDNLAEIINEADRRGIDGTAAINNYRTVKLARLNRGLLGDYVDALRTGALFSATLAIALLVGLMSLVLVLLAIERNTRHQKA